ncbi:hypothetical protein OQA88_5127 [Cercophora sp. LCS_1]
MHHSGKSLDIIIQDITENIRVHKQDFDDLADRLLRMVSEDEGKHDLARLINGLRTNATGTVDFCKLTKRYGNEQFVNGDGSMDIVF